jgi:hypothetical protein
MEHKKWCRKSWFKRNSLADCSRIICAMHTPYSIIDYSMEQSPFWEVKEFHAFYGTRKYITAFTSARHQSLSREIFDRHASVFFFFLDWFPYNGRHRHCTETDSTSLSAVLFSPPYRNCMQGIQFNNRVVCSKCCRRLYNFRAAASSLIYQFADTSWRVNWLPI